MSHVPHAASADEQPDDGAAPAGHPVPGVQGLCQQRRDNLPQALQTELDGIPLWGLALSGGGIRSATFCFGLLRALARNHILHRFDILSTVSGGGYIGSTLGRLYHEAQGTASAASAVEDALGQAETRWFAAWLRANGRYLIPMGGKDVLFALSNFGRNLLGVHIELAVLSLLLGGLLVGIDLGTWQWADCLYYGGCALPGQQGGNFDAQALLDFVSRWPPLWLLLPPVLFVGGILTCAYWALPARPGKGAARQPVVAALVSALAIVVVLRHWAGWWKDWPLTTGSIELPAWLVLLAVAFLAAWLLGAGLALARLHGGDMDAARNATTRGLSWMLSIALGIVALGLVDHLAWSLGNIQHVEKLGAALAVLAALLRAVMPKVADLPKSLTPGMRRAFMTLIDVAGMILAALVLVFWISLIHRTVSEALFSVDTPGRSQPLQFAPAYQWLAWIFVPALVYALISFGNREFLNRSSLFTFYRARLVRSYLGAGNPSRFLGGPHGPTDPLGPVDGGDTAPVTRVLRDDDIPMGTYAPHLAGGPVHLLNVCVNQTHDPRGALFNQDRKGLLLTVGPLGRMCYARDNWCQPDENRSSPMTLGSWVAISGAAVAPGLGASTRSGVAAILTMAGIRLGYWWNSAGLPGRRPRRQWSGKYGQLVDELRGRFDGEQCRDWYLSDGGHFENTGAYALLREECKLVIVADCGADPRYAFGDLENLVRKARIDLQADIAFLRPKRNAANLSEVYGSLNDLASADSQACLALARIHYRRSDTFGYMFIVKPNMCQGVPVDLVNFKADNPLFPQEPTTDQMFSEAQWESYFQLGKTLGAQIDLHCLLNAETFALQNFVDDDGAMLVRNTQTGAQTLSYAAKRLSSRIASTGVVSASVSFGAVASFGLAALQAVNTRVDANAAAARIDPAAFRELTDIFGKMSIQEGRTVGEDRVGEMATALLRFDDVVCNAHNAAAFRRSPLMTLMVKSTKAACLASAHPHAACANLLKDDLLQTPCLKTVPREGCVPMYWARDYAVPRLAGSALEQPNCPRTAAPLRVDADPAAATPWKVQPPAPPPAASAPSAPHVASAPAATPASAALAPSSKAACKGQTVYLQIYGPELRDDARPYRDLWRALGASVPTIEDVWDTARRAGRRLPTPYAAPTVLYRKEDSAASRASEACARALAPAGASPAWDVKPLPGAYAGTPGVIEVWLPPVASARK